MHLRTSQSATFSMSLSCCCFSSRGPYEKYPTVLLWGHFLLTSFPFLSNCASTASVNQIQFYAFYFPGFVNSHQRKRRQSNKGKTMGVFMCTTPILQHWHRVAQGAGKETKTIPSYSNKNPLLDHLHLITVACYNNFCSWKICKGPFPKSGMPNWHFAALYKHFGLI